MTSDQSNSSDRPEDHLVITRDASDDATLALQLDGDLDPFTAPLLTQELDESLGNGITTLELDVSRLRFLDSSGLRVLVVANNQLAPRDGSVVLKGATPTIRRVIEITGLDASLKLED